MPDDKKPIKRIAENRQAYHEYFILENIECGIELFGTEVKSIRNGRANMRFSYAEIENFQCYVCNLEIPPYEQGNIFNRDPLRKRRLLLHKAEIRKLYNTVMQKGVTLVPLELYFKGARVKMKLGVARGKKLYDKRDSAAQRDTQREIDREIKERNQ